MSDLARVRLNGRELNMSRAVAERVGVEILDEPTHNADGRPRASTGLNGGPVKEKTTVAKKAAAKKAASPVSKPEEAK